MLDIEISHLTTLIPFRSADHLFYTKYLLTLDMYSISVASYQTFRVLNIQDLSIDIWKNKYYIGVL